MSYIPIAQNREVNTDAGGRTRTSHITTLFDGKTLSVDDGLLWGNTGTGTATFLGGNTAEDNTTRLNVTAGQYIIRYGKHVCPYFSGKSQRVETTFDTFATTTGLVKRSGYFSSSPVAPYNTVKDGFWLESDNGAISLEIEKQGVVTASIPFTSFDNYEKLQNYNFNNFTVLLWDFLWLGGTEVRLFVKTEDGFILAHTYKHSSTKQGTFIKTPNHSVRYEIRSTTGVGTFNAICSEVATEGAFPEAGKPKVLINTTAVTTNTVGTIFVLKGVKKLAQFRDIVITATRASISNSTTNDIGTGFVIINPTLSAPLTYATNGVISEGTGTGQTVVPGTGRIIAAFPSGNAGSISGANDSLLSSIDMNIDNVSGEIILAYMPTTSNQAVFGTLTVKEY
jgi:hypothetical protein